MYLDALVFDTLFLCTKNSGFELFLNKSETVIPEGAILTHSCRPCIMGGVDGDEEW